MTEMPRLAVQMKDAVDQDQAAFHMQMCLKGAMMTRGIYEQFPEAPPLQRAERYVWDPIKESVWTPRNWPRLSTLLRAWLSETPTMAIDDIVVGIMNMREFFRCPEDLKIDVPWFSWFPNDRMDMTIIYMVRTLAPPSRRLNMAIRRIILAGPEDERTMMVRAFQEPDMYRVISEALKQAPRHSFLNPLFRKDCEIALACASANLNDKNPDLLPMRFCLERAAVLARRLPAISAHVSLWNDKLPSPSVLANYFSATDEPEVIIKAAHIIGYA
jgi:hypothetical protein